MNEPKTRAEIPAAYTWKLEDIFESDEAWEQAFLTAQAETEKVEACRGTLGESPEKLSLHFFCSFPRLRSRGFRRCFAGLLRRLFDCRLFRRLYINHAKA